MSADPGPRIRYADSPREMPVHVVYAWDRGEIAAAVSSSSGDKDYIKNEVFRLFEAAPVIDRIVIVRGPAVQLFYLIRHARGTWHDTTGRQIVSV